jgi:UPF0176 protein
MFNSRLPPGNSTEVYQIKDGVVRDGDNFGDDSSWEGSIFTFDNRLSLEFSYYT